MMSRPRTFLVTGARAPATLEIIRRLGRAGHDVLAADCVHAPLGRFSRYVRRYFRVPAPREDTAGFVAALRRIARDEEVDVLLPTCEEIYYVSRHRETLAGTCEVFCAGFDVLETLHHKEHFVRLVDRLGKSAAGLVISPESVLIEEAGQLPAFAARSRDLVFKPVYSRFASRTLIRPSPAWVMRLPIDPANPWLAQRYVAGRELSSCSIAVRGRLTAHTLYHSRHRAGRGAGVYFVAEENAAVLAFVEQIVEHLDFAGQIAFDFIQCDATRRMFVLECNPRLTSGVHLFGPDFDLDAALRGETVLQPGNGAKMLAAAMLFHGFGQALRGGGVTAWAHDLAAGSDVISARDDRLPVLGQLAFLTEMAARSIRRRTGLIAAMTADIEWNGEPLP